MSVWVTPFNYSYLRAECEKVALRVDAPTAVVGQHDSEDLFAKRRGYSAMARQPGGVHVDEKSFQQLEELCEQIVDTTGLAASIMQVALMKEGEKRTLRRRGSCNMRVWANWCSVQDSLTAAVGTQCVPWLQPKY